MAPNVQVLSGRPPNHRHIGPPQMRIRHNTGRRDRAHSSLLRSVKSVLLLDCDHALGQARSSAAAAMNGTCTSAWRERAIGCSVAQYTADQPAAL